MWILGLEGLKGQNKKASQSHNSTFVELDYTNLLDLRQPLFCHQQLPWQHILRITWNYFLASSTDN